VRQGYEDVRFRADQLGMPDLDVTTNTMVADFTSVLVGSADKTRKSANVTLRDEVAR
jgi:hypothetical protein